MFQFLTFLAKKPSDSQLRYGKIIYGILLIMVGLIAFRVQGLILQDSIFGQTLSTETKEILSYILIGFGIIPTLLGAFDIHFLKSGKAKILQIVFGVFLIWVGSLFQEQASLGINIVYTLLGILTILG